MPDFNFNELTDEEVVEMAQKGNDAASEYLIEKYRETAKLKARKYYIIGAEVEDVVQEGMIGIFKAIRGYNPDAGAAFSSFLQLCVERQIMTAVTSANRDKHKALNHSVSLDVDDTSGENEGGKAIHSAAEETLAAEGGSGDGRDPSEIAVENENILDMMSISEEILTDLEQRVWLAMISGKNYKEVAEELGRSPKTIDNAMQRVKKKMRNHLSIG